MTHAEFDSWLPRAIVGYAEEHISSGRWSSDTGLERSREEHAKLLPQGIETPHHHFWTIVRGGDRQRVGILWMAEIEEPPRHAFIYNIEIEEQHRRRGYAEQAMRLAEKEAKKLGMDTMRLHVFGNNTRARPLYEKLGYEATNILMAKKLTGKN